jgi:hypothetical protein
MLNKINKVGQEMVEGLWSRGGRRAWKVTLRAAARA